MSRSTLLTRVRQVASPRKSVKTRLDRVQKINKVSKSLFGPVIQSEFRRYAQLEMSKYQVQASEKWNFDFMKEAPIKCANSQFKWEPSAIVEIPKFYHQIFHSSRLVQHHPSIPSNECENICPLSPHISSSSMIIQNSNKRKIIRDVSTAATSFKTTTIRSGQTKITDYLKIRKRRMSTTVCLKKARADC